MRRSEWIARDCFDATWDALAQQGVCDARGSVEYVRVMTAWVSASHTENIEAFIRREANVPPKP